MYKLLLLICVSIFCVPVLAQTGKDNNVPLFFEKTYLHTDRDVYGQSEDIWFKAYLVNAQDNTPISYSHTLYVELINPEAKIITRNIIRLDNGTGNGDFKLTDSIPAGHYLIRAYTNWMRNFGDNFIFEKPIIILNTTEATAVAAATKPVTARSPVITDRVIATPSNLPTINFFPESGSLVAGISSIVGVKAENATGKGIAAKGNILSSSGDTVSHFNCDSLGIGLFTLLPVKGQTYRALIDLNGMNQIQNNHSIFELPVILSKGLTLQIRQTDSVIRAVVNMAAEPGDTAKTRTASMIVRHSGKTLLSQQLSLTRAQTAFRVGTATLPEGISAITLYDEQGKPQCERLVYVHHPGNAGIAMQTDKKIYQPKEKVSVNISSAPNSSLSLAVVDARTVPVQSENILSYLNLQSEIKGNIEQPNRYFDTANVNRFKQLDQLLLTQGWRNFVWRSMEDTSLKLNYEPEQGIAVTGMVRAVMGKKPLPGIDINMHAPKAVGTKFFNAVTDSAGRFGIYGLKFYGYQYLYLSARNYSSKAKGKSNSGGWLQVDSLVRDTLPVRLTKQFSADDSLLLTNPLLTLNIPASRQLKEVQIKGSNQHANSIAPEHRTLSMSEQKNYGNVLQYLLYTIPEAHAGGGECGIILMDNNAPPYQQPIGIGGSYADRSPVERTACPSDFLMLPMSNVLKLTIYRAYDGDFRLRLNVSLVLRPGSLKVKDFFDDTMADMNGYYQARVFYKPNYEGPPVISDQRTNTIYWEPNIKTDASGKATVSFYNAVPQTKVRVIVEGITDAGTPLVATTNYEVK